VNVSTPIPTTQEPVTAPGIPPRTTPTRMLARIAAGAGVAALAAIALAGSLDPGYSRVSEAISALASTESVAAPVMVVGFLAMALTLLAAGAALFGALRGKRAKVGASLVLLAGLMTVVVGLARQSCSSLQAECLARESAGAVSASHWVHNLVSLPLFLFLVVAGFLWGAGLRRATGSKHLARTALVVAVVTAVFLVWFGSDAYGSYGGLVERVLVWLAFGWPVYLAVRVTRPARAAA
jgi:hypothetical membrane protein